MVVCVQRKPVSTFFQKRKLCSEKLKLCGKCDTKRGIFTDSARRKSHVPLSCHFCPNKVLCMSAVGGCAAAGVRKIVGGR